jgi:cell division protein FtsW
MGLVAILTLFGWVMVYSSSVIVAFSQDKPSWFYFFRQFLWICAGLVSGFILYKLDYKQIAKLSPVIITTAIILLLAVLLVGEEINGSKRWIDLGFFDFQPSEFAKLGFIIYLSSWLSRKVHQDKHMSQIKRYMFYEMIPFLAILAAILILVLVEPDLGTTGIIGLTALSMYYLSGQGYIHNIGFGLILTTSVVVGLLAAVLESYRIQRITTFLEVLKTGTPADRLGSGYQPSFDRSRLRRTTWSRIRPIKTKI